MSDKVKIKIAVCVDDRGNYNSCGFKHILTRQVAIADYTDMLNRAEEGLDFPLIRKTFWLEAEIEKPCEQSIEAIVNEEIGK